MYVLALKFSRQENNEAILRRGIMVDLQVNPAHLIIQKL